MRRHNFLKIPTKAGELEGVLERSNAKEDVQKLFAELCDPEDEDGLFPYMSFLDR